jgi:hypothetical protein
VLLAVVTPLLVLVSLVGWIGLLFNGRTPEPVVEFGQSLADWYARTARYLTGNARRRPFPFEDMDCPADDPGVGRTARPGVSKSAEPASKPVDEPADKSSDKSGEPGRSGSRPEPSVAAKPASKSKPGGKKASQKKAGQKKASKKSTRKKASKKSAGKKAGADKSTGNQATGEQPGEKAGTESASVDRGESNRDD